MYKKKGNETMKHRKLLATVLTLVLAFALASPAAPVFAADNGKITITNPSTAISIDGVTFYAYRIFDLESYDNDTGNYAYKINEYFEDLVYQVGSDTYGEGGGSHAGTIADYLSDTASYSDQLNTFANWVYENYIDEAAFGGSPLTVTGTSDQTAIFDYLPLGYYLVYTAGFDTNGDSNVDLVAANILTTTDNAVTVTLKADLPTLEKGVSDTTDGEPEMSTDLNIGDTAYFTLTSAVPNMNGYTSYTYIVHDTLSAGLDFDDNVAVKIDSVTYNDFTLTYTVNDDDTTTIAIDVDLDSLIDPVNNANTGKSIVITYSATLNSVAVVVASGVGNPNKAYLEYSNNPYDANEKGTTPDETVNVYTFEFDIFKYTVDDNETPADTADDFDKGLQFAEFELHTNADSDTPKWFVLDSGVYKVVAGSSVSGATKTLISGSDGKIKIKGLDQDTYYLKETKAPVGYNALTAPTTVTINASYNNNNGYLTEYKVNNTIASTAVPVEIKVRNNTGIEFPESGGIGRTIFTVIGLLLMLGAAVILIARRKTAVDR
jgi:fimbrial isopeptide formation D2 family protein/LPXTG-motif cell wall-anchored protein